MWKGCCGLNDDATCATRDFNSTAGAAGHRVVGGLGAIWGENAGGLVRPGGGNVWGIARVEGVALFG